MSGRTHFGCIESRRVFEKLFHPGAIWRKHLGDVGLRPLGLAEPPDGVHRVLHSQLSLVHPYDGAWQLRRIKPIKILREEKPQIVAKPDQYSKIIQTSRWKSFFIGSTKIEHKAAVILQDPMDLLCELRQPIDVINLIFVAICFLSLEG